ncbi:MAG: hypothetical protein CMN56_13670 [Sneathiella sp.]|uniref:hypothetical protein n=1 Tax=Sneathiella sp. TaxID=1964365 RepID=UPI000C59F277|nr:hypothetical protein [Sneathiella sp.]MAZ04175.1 hypothetical protein [Sneathiella sp.]
MIRTGRKKEWSILLFVVCLIAFVPPMISLFDVPTLISGIPISYLYMFGVWAAVIAMTALGARRGIEKTVETPGTGRDRIAADSERGNE